MTKKIIILYGVIHTAIMGISIICSQSKVSMFDAGYLMNDTWYKTTLVDMYLAFFLILIYLFNIEKSWVKRIVFSVLTLGFGNLGIGLIIIYLGLKSTNEITLKEFLKGENIA